MATMTMHKADSQVTVILNHLQTGAEINPLEALSRYGVYRLGAVILSRIETFKKANGRPGKYAVYKLIPKEVKKNAE